MNGEGIFLQWSGAAHDLAKVKRGAQVMRDNGTTFRGCSYDERVYFRDACPVCHCPGTSAVDFPVGEELERRGPVGAPRSHWQPKKLKTR